MGSYEAGAASALRGLGSEPCGASRVYDDCGLPSRAHPMALDGVVATGCARAVPMRVPGACRHRIGRRLARARRRAAGGRAAGGRVQRCETRGFATRRFESGIVTETHAARCTPSRAAALRLPHHSSLPGVARVPVTPIGCTSRLLINGIGATQA